MRVHAHWLDRLRFVNGGVVGNNRRPANSRYMGKAVSLSNVYGAPPNAHACANAWAGIASDVPNGGHAGAVTGEVHGCTEWR